MSWMGFERNELAELSYAAAYVPFPELRHRYRKSLKVLRSDETAARLLSELEDAHHDFDVLIRKYAKQSGVAVSKGEAIDEWLRSPGIDPVTMSPEAHDVLAKARPELLKQIQRYLHAAKEFSAYVRELAHVLDSMGAAETDHSMSRAISAGPDDPGMVSSAYSEPRGFAAVNAKGASSSSEDPWELLGRALISGDVEGAIYIGGDVSDATVRLVEEAVESIVETGGRTTEWGKPVRGSWWRPFKTKVGSRFKASDLDTLKRAAEVQLLDRYEGEAAKNYAEALASLVSAAEHTDHAHFCTQNVIVLKTTDANGQSVTVGRVLTPREASMYQAGELERVLAEPETALKFLRTGALPVIERPGGEGDAPTAGAHG